MPVIDDKKAKSVQDSFNSATMLGSEKPPEPKKDKPKTDIAEYSMDAISRRLGL